MNEEAVRDLVLFSFVVFEAWAVIKREIFYHDLVGNRRLGILLMANFDVMVGAVKDWFESIVADHHLGTRQKSHHCAFSDTSVSDHDNGLIAVGVLGDTRNAAFDHFSKFEQVQRVFHVSKLN